MSDQTNRIDISNVLETNLNATQPQGIDSYLSADEEQLLTPAQNSFLSISLSSSKPQAGLLKNSSAVDSNYIENSGTLLDPLKVNNSGITPALNNLQTPVGYPDPTATDIQEETDTTPIGYPDPVVTDIQ